MKQIKTIFLGLVLLLSAALLTPSAHAYSAAAAKCKSSSAFGTLAYRYNYSTPSAAVNASVATLRNYGCTSWSYNWWTYRGYGGIGRGFNYYGDYYSSYTAWGWGTYSGAYNRIANYIYYYPYRRAILVAYNN